MERNFGVKIASAVAIIALAGSALLLSPPRAESVEVRAAETDAPAASPKQDELFLAFYDGSPYAIVNEAKKQLGQSPVVTAQAHADALYVPARFMAEVYGGNVEWMQQSQTISLTCRGISISYVVGSAEMRVDGKNISISAPSRIVNNRAYIPVGSFAAAIGAEYSLDNGLAVISDGKINFDKEGLIARLKTLPVVGTEEKFAELMSELQERNNVYLYNGSAIRAGGMEGVMVQEAQFDAGATATAGATPAPIAETPMVASDSTAQKSVAAEPANDYSATNVQVAGVDEADVIKTDGEYIYYAKRNGVSIVKAVPAGDMKLVSTLTFSEKGGFQPQEMYVDGNELVIIGASMREFYVNGVPNYQTMTKAYVYNTADKAAPKKVREVESEGNYVSSRKIGKAVYIVSNSWIYNVAEGIYPKPVYYDTATANEYKTIGYDRIYYFPNFTVSNYLFITGFESDKPKQEAKVNAYLGSGQSVYVSLKNMYVASTEYAQVRAVPFKEASVSYGSAPETAVYKFALDNGNVSYEGKQSVPGTILNQFSMDEYDGHFRIATTSYDENYQQINGLYILDDKLAITGKIDDMAPGERIYSARFMGKRAYIVTFKNVDPLFVIDLADHNSPKILGALKIPGYSNYLHPYDENHLIGIGKDTVENKGVALYQGMKLSLYDVTDVANPKEMFVEIIGDRGTESSVLYDHKALLFDRDRDLIAFPISVSTLKPEQKNDPWQYGEFTFQGAYVYGLDLKNGFTLRTKITHMDEQDMLKSGMYSWNYTKSVERVIYIGDYLYTASQAMIKSTGMKDMKDAGSVELE